MLILTLDKNNVIELDGGIEIQLIRGQHGQARVGIKAPREVKIARKPASNRNASM